MDALLFSKRGHYIGSTRITLVPEVIIWKGEAFIRDTVPVTPPARESGSPRYRQVEVTFTATTIDVPAQKEAPAPGERCIGYRSNFDPAKNAPGPRCCERAGEYNGFGTGERAFACPKSCGCHD